MARNLRNWTVLAAGVLAVCVLSYLGLRAYRARPMTPAGGGESVTLDPKLFRARIRDGYQAARDNPALIGQLYCYCGCDKNEGHTSLLDCFRDKHGASCEICIGEAIEAVQMSRQGMTLDQIRDILRARYGRG